MSRIIIIGIVALVAVIEIPVVVIVLARSGPSQTRHLRVAIGLFVVLFVTAILGALILPKIIH